MNGDYLDELLIRRLAELPRQGERTENGGTVISTGERLWAINLAQLDQLITSARQLLGQPVNRPDYDAEETE